MSCGKKIKNCHCSKFLWHFLMNEFTNIAIPTYFQFIQMPIIETKLGAICILTIYAEALSWMIANWMKLSLSKWQYLQHCTSTMLKSVYKEWRNMLGWHFVLVAPYCNVQLVSSKTIKIGDTIYYIKCSIWFMNTSRKLWQPWSAIAKQLEIICKGFPTVYYKPQIPRVQYVHGKKKF